MQKGKYPNTFYRVSAKAVIFNDKNEVLVIREDDEHTFPGGGVDHGEAPLVALKREMYEEALITSDFTAEFIGAESFYAESKEAMAFWLLYKIDMHEKDFSYQAIEDGTELSFVNPAIFKDSASPFEQIVYTYGTKHL